MNLAFLREYIREPLKVGSVMPSSPFLTNAMLHHVDFGRARYIVELGPGNGCITKKILRRMSLDSRLVCFETNEAFCSMLSKLSDKRLRIIPDSAENMREYLKRKPDYVVSGIPLAVIHEETRKAIIDSVACCLKPSGRYIQFQYSLASYAELKRHFNVSLGFTPLNVPPAFVYVCTPKRFK